MRVHPSEPYDYKSNRYAHTYCEEESQEEIEQSEKFKEIMNRQVDYFHILGGGVYEVELCIFLKPERSAVMNRTGKHRLGGNDND